MNEINGYPIDTDLSIFTRVSDLIYFDGPLLSHYVDKNGENYLFMWVDTDGVYNRWIYFNIDIDTLNHYLKKDYSLLEVIKKKAQPFCYFVDIDNNANHFNNSILLWQDFPQDILPEEDSYYDFEPIQNSDLASYSKKNESGIFELRLFTEIDTHQPLTLAKVAPIFPLFEDVRKSLANGYTKNIRKELRRNRQRVPSDLTRTISLNTNYQVILAMAGSFRLIFKPLNDQYDIPGTKSTSDEFAAELIKLVLSGLSREEIEGFANKYNKALIKKYNDLVHYLNESRLGIDVKWFNLNSNFSLGEKLTNELTSNILYNLSGFNYDETEEIRLQGRFYAINVNTGRYSFESTEGDDFKSHGMFDPDRARMAYQIMFNKTYSIIIKRQVQELVGGKEKITDTCVSFIEHEDLNM